MYIQSIIKNSAVVYAMTLVTLGLGLAIIPLFIEKLSLSIYGVWLIPSIFAGQLQLIDLGLTDGLKRELTKSYTNEDWVKSGEILFSIVIFLCLIGGIFSASIYFASALIVDAFNVPEDKIVTAVDFLKVSSFSVFLSWILMIYLVIYESLLLHRWGAVFSTFQAMIVQLAILYAVYMGYEISSIKIFEIAVLLLFLFIGFVIFYTKNNVCLTIVSPLSVYNNFKGVFKYSMGVMYSKLLTYSSLRIDPFILGLMIGPAAIAIYDLVTKPYAGFNMIVNKIMSVIFTTTISMNEKVGRTGLKKYYMFTVIMRVFVTAPFVFFAIYLFDDIMMLWVGDSVSSDAQWGKLMLLILMLTIPSSIANIMRSLGFLKGLNVIHTVFSILNVFLSIYLVQYFGIGGPIIASVIALAFTSVIVAIRYTNVIADLKAGFVYLYVVVTSLVYLIIMMVVTDTIMGLVDGVYGMIFSISVIYLISYPVARYSYFYIK